MLEYIERPACVCGESLSESAAQIRKRAAWGEIRFLQCTRCGSWCQNPQVAPASLARWYDSDDYQGSASQRGATYAHYLDDEAERLVEAGSRYRRDLARYLANGPGHILEIGCATGSMLSVLSQAGHQVTGVDISQRFANDARRLNGLDIQVGDFADVDLPEAAFDLVLLLGTASNLWDLSGSLTRIRRLLKERGVLILNVPTADSMVARIYGGRSWMFAPSASVFMSQAGCRAALERAGFVIAEERTDWQQPSIRKVMKHAGAGWLIPPLERLGAGKMALPVAVPIPGVRLVCASRAV